MITSLVLSVFSVFTLNAFSEDLPAFPGATGGGAVSVGGRGGRVIEVITLADSGAGSFREAVEATGPRTIIFKVGGTIELQSQIVITHPYLTIAGQTAPGDGIMLRSTAGMLYSSLLIHDCHDIIIRYIRVRPGPYAKNQAGDGINTYVHAHNVIIDHCSLSWSTDENTEVWTKENPGYNFTWSWNIIAEGLDMDHNHSCGLLAGSDDDSEGMHDISVHHNFFAHNNKRNPNMKVKTAEIISNLIYGWNSYATQIGGGTTIDIIGNKYVPQPGLSQNRREVLWKPYNPAPVVYDHPVSPVATGPTGAPSIYITGNIGPHNSNPLADSWYAMLEMTSIKDWGWPDLDDDGQTAVADVPIEYRRDTRRTTLYPVQVDDVTRLDDILLAPLGAGASMRLNNSGNMTGNRDSVDQRIINEYHNRSGIIPNKSPAEVGGYPVLAGGSPYSDRDHDGMPDTWEDNNHLNPDDPSDRNATGLSSAGYTNLEVFLNAISPEANGNSDVSGSPIPGIYFLLKQQ